MTRDKDTQLIWEHYTSKNTILNENQYTWDNWTQNPDYANILQMKSDDFKHKYSIENLQNLKNLMKNTDPAGHDREKFAFLARVQDAIMSYDYKSDNNQPTSVADTNDNRDEQRTSQDDDSPSVEDMINWYKTDPIGRRAWMSGAEIDFENLADGRDPDGIRARYPGWTEDDFQRVLDSV